jgi:hypothetical protein
MMNKKFDNLGSGITAILTDLQRLEAERRDQVMRDQRTGMVDYDLQAQ